MTGFPLAADPTPGARRLTDVVRGRVTVPGDEGFESARAPWNSFVDQPVDAVVEVVDADDVSRLVAHAAANGLTVSPQANGHGSTGSTAGSILLRTRGLGGIEIDQENRLARVGAGVRSGELQAAAAPFGLTGLPGSSPVVSVVGVVLGGGLSWFGRAHGWVADSVRRFEVVDATGRQVLVTAESDPELFWALRGGGGGCAVVTAVEVELHPAPALFGGRLMWPGTLADSVGQTYLDLTESAPIELTAWLELLHFPGAEPVVALDVTHLGSEAEARELLAALRPLPRPLTDTLRMMNVDELGSITAEPTDPSPGISRGELVTSLEGCVDVLTSSAIDPLMSVQVRHLGGAFTRASDSPHGSLHEQGAVYMFGSPVDAERIPAIRSKAEQIAQALPTSGRKPFTFLAPGESARAAFDPATVLRLAAIKQKWDPDGVFRANFSVLEC